MKTRLGWRARPAVLRAHARGAVFLILYLRLCYEYRAWTAGSCSKPSRWLNGWASAQSSVQLDLLSPSSILLAWASLSSAVETFHRRYRRQLDAAKTDRLGPRLSSAWESRRIRQVNRRALQGEGGSLPGSLQWPAISGGLRFQSGISSLGPESPEGGRRNARPRESAALDSAGVERFPMSDGGWGAGSPARREHKSGGQMEDTPPGSAGALSGAMGSWWRATRQWVQHNKRPAFAGPCPDPRGPARIIPARRRSTGPASGLSLSALIWVRTTMPPRGNAEYWR